VGAAKNATMTAPLISVVVVTYNSRQDIAACLQALLASVGTRPEITVVDNCSGDGTADVVAADFPSVRLLRSPANLGFGGGNNLGFAASTGDLLVTVNPDVRLRAGALQALATAFAADTRLGIAGAKLFFADGSTIQHAGGIVNYPLATTWHRGYQEVDAGQYEEPADVSFVTGAVLAMRRTVFEKTGGFDIGFYPVYYEDVDLCYRARRAGWRVVYLPTVVGLHRTSVSLDRTGETYFRFFHTSRVRFVMKHYTTDELLEAFLPAEVGRVQAELPDADLRATGEMYRRKRELLLPMPAVGQEQARRQEQELQMQTQADQRALEELARSSQLDMDELTHQVGHLHERWRIEERPFVSHVPVLGPLVVRLRTAWNNVAARWYVQGMMQQQVEFNAAVVHATTTLLQAVQTLSSDAAAHAQAVRILSSNLTTHEQAIRALSSDVARVEQRNAETLEAVMIAPTLIADRLRVLEERIEGMEKTSGTS
jgi:O-antigen biosynthesis protein